MVRVCSKSLECSLWLNWTPLQKSPRGGGLLGKLVLQRISTEKEPNTHVKCEAFCRHLGEWHLQPFGSTGKHGSLFYPSSLAKICVGQEWWGCHSGKFFLFWSDLWNPSDPPRG